MGFDLEKDWFEAYNIVWGVKAILDVYLLGSVYWEKYLDYALVAAVSIISQGSTPSLADEVEIESSTVPELTQMAMILD